MKVLAVLSHLSIATCAVITASSSAKFQPALNRVRGPASNRQTVSPVQARIGVLQKPRYGPAASINRMPASGLDSKIANFQKDVPNFVIEDIVKGATTLKASPSSGLPEYKCPAGLPLFLNSILTHFTPEEIEDLSDGKSNPLAKREINPDTIEELLMYHTWMILILRCGFGVPFASVNKNARGWILLETGLAGWVFLKVIMPLIIAEVNAGSVVHGIH